MSILRVPKTISIAVKALIERDGKMLLLKNGRSDDAFWVPPGGGIEFGESPRKAMKREVREEIGVESVVNEPIGMYYFFYNGGESQGVLTLYDVNIGNQQIAVGDDTDTDETISDYEWVHPEEAANRCESEADTLETLIRGYFEI